MFDHPADDYNLVLSLNRQSLTRYHHNVKAEPSSLPNQGKHQNEAGNVLVQPGFDPAMAYFKDLQRVYADTFRVFYDPFGGERIGAVWDPSLKVSRPFRVLGGFSSAPASADAASSVKVRKLHGDIWLLDLPNHPTGELKIKFLKKGKGSSDAQ